MELRSSIVDLTQTMGGKGVEMEEDYCRDWENKRKTGSINDIFQFCPSETDPFQVKFWKYFR